MSKFASSLIKDPNTEITLSGKSWAELIGISLKRFQSRINEYGLTDEKTFKIGKLTTSGTDRELNKGNDAYKALGDRVRTENLCNCGTYTDLEYQLYGRESVHY